ncbi:MAG: right-handed parallel beta-helix repeat-containing protein [Bacteroidales bacterium]|nr:right-handed parallel beta-helix repeat-containing protein [Bacteroidales bacterium]
MKTRLMLILGIAMILFSNCAEKTIDSPFNTAVVVANMETDLVKSSATDEGFFTWAAGDKIAIHTNAGEMLEGTLNEGAGTASGSFGYSFVGDKPELTGYAVYPYNSGHEIDESNLTFVMPDSYDLGETLANTNAAMFAKNSSGTNYNFTHLGGVFRFIIKNAPVGSDRFTLSLGGKKINGEFSVALNAEELMIETAEGSDENNTTTLNFNALESIQDITLFVPVPVGEYTGITAKLYKGDEEIGSWGSVTAVNNVSRKSLKLMAPITYSNVSGDIQNEIQVASAEQLKSALEQGGVIEIVDDIEGLTEILVISKDVVINGNEHTITSSAGRAINVSGATDVTIKNLTIQASGERAINIIQNTKKVTIDNVTATAANYTLNLASSASNVVVVVNNSTFTGLNAVNIGASYADVTIEESSITTVDNNEKEGYSTIALNKDAEYAKVIVTNSTINITGSAATDSRKASIGAEGCYISINGSTDVAESHVACIEYGDYYYGFTEIGHALNKAVAGETIKLLRDVTITEKITIDKSITLDGGNHSITSNVQSDPLNHRAINVTGVNEVTIKNLTIETNGERAINIIGGTKKVILDNVTATSSHYPVNIASSAPNSNLTITNSELTGLNVVNSSAEGSDIEIENTVLTIVDDSDVEGYGAVHLDKPNSKVAVKGCEINIQGAHTNYSYGFVVMAGNLVSCTNTSGNTTVKGCYAIIEYPGSNYFYSFGSLEEAIAKAESGETVKLIADITIDQTINIEKNVTIDLNGKKLTANAKGARAFKVNADNVNFTLDATDSNVEFGNGTYGIVEIANEVNNAKVTIKGGTFVGTTDDGCLIRYRSGNNNEVEINNVNYTDNCTVSDDNTNAFVIGTNGVGEGNKLTVKGGTYAATGIIADDRLSEVLFEGVTVNAKGIGFELKNGEIRDSKITLDPGAYVYSIDGAPILASNSGKIIVSNTTIETSSGYGLVVAPTGGEIVATDITINAAEGKEYYIYQMYEGKVGKISVDGEIVAQQSNK